MNHSSISFHSLLSLPADEFVSALYEQLLERQPSFEELAYHLSKLTRGYSRKQLVLMVYYSAECQQKFPMKHLEGGRLLALFHRLTLRHLVLAKILVKALYAIDVLRGVAKERAYQFTAEWQLYSQEKMRKQQELLRYEVSILQQDVQRRIDLFLMDAAQKINSIQLSNDEKHSAYCHIRDARDHLTRS
jgi:hypothetical protein